MKKVIVLEVIDNDVKEQCTINVSIRDELDSVLERQTFTITSSVSNVLRKAQLWQKEFENHASLTDSRLGSGMRTPGAYKSNVNYANRQFEESLTQCKDSQTELVRSLNDFLNDSALHTWLRENLENTKESIRAIVQVNKLEMAIVPWEQAEIWNNLYERNDLVVGLGLSHNQKKTEVSNQREVTHKPEIYTTRILVVQGSTKGIDIETDKKEFGSFKEEFNSFKNDIKKLENRADVIIETCKPNLTELKNLLKQSWNIIYLCGHGEFIEEYQDGLFVLSDQAKVKTSELEEDFKNLINDGSLRLLISNTCQGIGTAYRLVNFGLPQVIVMRTSIPDDFAHDFLRSLLELFIIGLPCSSAVKHARPYLREAYDQHHQLPGASMLPALCLTSTSVDLLDEPVIPTNQLHPICKEMRALANLAKRRLEVADYSNESALKIQEYYANELRQKNEVVTESPTIVDPDKVSTSYRMTGKLIWEITFTVNFHDRDLVWGQGYVNVQTGESELLLDHRPSFWTGTDVVINGEEVKQLEISKDKGIQVKGVEQKPTFTKIALLRLEQEYKEYVESNSNFKGAHSIHSFGGWLKDVNRRVFQKKFAVFRCTFNHNESLNRAYLSTPFGKARSELGISEFQLEIPSWKKLIDLIELEDWHENNEPGTGRDIQYLRDNGVSDSQWHEICVPDRIIATKVRKPQTSDLNHNIEWLI